MADEKKFKFGLGLILGSIIGGLAALFMTPKTGRELREITKKRLSEELEKLKKLSGKLDKEKFQKAVEAVLKKINKDFKKGTKELGKLKNDLLSNLDKEKKQVKK